MAKVSLNWRVLVRCVRCLADYSLLQNGLPLHAFLPAGRTPPFFNALFVLSIADLAITHFHVFYYSD